MAVEIPKSRSETLWLTTLLACLIFISGSPSASQEIVLGTFNYPPLMFSQENKRGQRGIGIDLIVRAFEYNRNYKLKIEIYPPKRAMAEFKLGSTDIFLGSRLDVPSVSETSIALQILPLRSVLFCLPINCDRIEQSSSFDKLGAVATLIGSPVNHQLREAGNHVTTFQSLERSFHFMLAGRSDFVAAIDFSGLYVLSRIDSIDSAKIKMFSTPLLKIPYDAVILKSNPHIDVIASLLQAEISKTTNSRTSTERVNQYLTQTLKTPSLSHQ